MANYCFALVLLVLGFQGAGAVLCLKSTKNIWNYYETTYIYCSTSCCGSSTSRYCCYDTYTYGTGSIAGGVIGGLIFLFIIVAITVCICKHNNHKTTTVHNIQSQPANPSVFVVNHNTQSYGGNQPMYPPAYPPAR